MGRLRLTDRQLDEYRDAFLARSERFDRLGIPYLFAPVPMKEGIYSEFLPDGIEFPTVRDGDPASAVDLNPMPIEAFALRGSFMRQVVPYLFRHFRRIACLWMPNPPFSIIEQEQPDIVIQLMAERFLIRSPLMPDWELEPEPPVAFEPTLGTVVSRCEH